MKSPAIKNPGIILASQSPRRKDLLSSAGLSFAVFPSDVDESGISAPTPQAFAEKAALMKATAVANRYPDHYVIGSDTIVVVDEHILGKPKDKEDARAMLTRLQGRWHQVMSGYALCQASKGWSVSHTVVTDVLFDSLSSADINWYLETGEPFDKAGAYAIQGHGAMMVKEIKGSYTNVVGLPLNEILRDLIFHGIVTYH